MPGTADDAAAAGLRPQGARLPIERHVAGRQAPEPDKTANEPTKTGDGRRAPSTTTDPAGVAVTVVQGPGAAAAGAAPVAPRRTAVSGGRRADRRGARRPHLAYVVHSLNPGGTERLALDMARTFSRAARVSVLCLDTPGLWAPRARELGLPVHCLWRQEGIDWVTAARIAAYCRREQVDLLHAHQVTPWFYSALARLRVPAPRLLLHEHGRFFPEVLSRPRYWLNRALLQRLTHRVTAVSEDVRQRLATYEGIAARRVDVVLNGTIPEQPLSATHRAAWRASLGFGPEHRVVGTVGRLDPIKNLPMWVEAFGRASARVPALRGVIVGDGPQRAELEARIRARGLTPLIRLTGHRDDARRMTGIFDVFALASRSEGISMAVLDAMAAGVPVVATAVGGTPEIIVAPGQGWLVPDDDTDAFADALALAARDADQARQVGEHGRRRYQDSFTFDTMIQRYATLYGEMLADGPVFDARLLRAGGRR